MSLKNIIKKNQEIQKEWNEEEKKQYSIYSDFYQWLKEGMSFKNKVRMYDVRCGIQCSSEKNNSIQDHWPIKRSKRVQRSCEFQAKLYYRLRLLF